MYKPSSDLLTIVRNAFPLQLFPFDGYFGRMAEADYLCGRADVMAVKSYFIRSLPFGGSYALLGGVAEMLRTVMDLRLDDPDFQAGLRDLDHNPKFCDYLAKEQHLKLQIFSGLEGAPFFAHEPIVSVVGPLSHIRFWEGIATEALNFSSLVLTKWTRFGRSVRPGQYMDFSRRRSQNHMKAGLYAILSGASSTSNVELRRFADVKVGATMGHEWMMSYGNVEKAFDAWLRVEPRRPIGLIDTLQTMKIDFPAWLAAVSNHREEIRNANPLLWGWRNDSGDLAELALSQYDTFLRHSLAQDEWFRDRMRIFLTNDLDEYTTREIIGQIVTQARSSGLDSEDLLSRIIWAAGTKPGTCDDQPSLGGVAKLQEVETHSCIKLAFTADGKPGVKTSIPGFNRSALVYDRAGQPSFLYVYPFDRYTVRDGKFCDSRSGGRVLETIPCRGFDGSRVESPLDYRAITQQELLYDSLNGNGLTPCWDSPTISSVAERIRVRLDALGFRYDRPEGGSLLPLVLSPDLADLRRRMIEQGVLWSNMVEL